MSAPVTAESLTDEQIRAFRDSQAGSDAASQHMRYRCDLAQGKFSLGCTRKMIRTARRSIADAINARAKVDDVVASVERNPGVTEANVRSNLRSEHGDSTALDSALASGEVVRRDHKLYVLSKGEV